MTLIQRPGRAMWYAVTKINGKTFKRSTGTADKREAQKYHDGEFARLVALMRTSPHVSLDLDAAMVAEVKRIKIEVSEVQGKRVGQALFNFAEWIGETSLDRITTNDLYQYQLDRIQQVSQRTVRLELDHILCLLKHNGFFIERPKMVQGKTTPNREFTLEELDKFFEACSERYKTLFLTLLVTGARPAELFHSTKSKHVPLLKTEVDKDAGTILIRSAKQKAGSKSLKRLLPVPPSLCEKILAEAPKDKPYAFRAFSEGGLAHVFDRILVKAGLATQEPPPEKKKGEKGEKRNNAHRRVVKVNELGEKLTAHSFRHTFATLLHTAAQGDLAVIRRALGHTQITTTMRYDHYAGTVEVGIGRWLIEAAG